MGMVVALALVEQELIVNGNHMLAACILDPTAGFDYPATAVRFAAFSSISTRVDDCTNGD